MEPLFLRFRAVEGEWLSLGRSIDYNNTIYLTTGHIPFQGADGVGKFDGLSNGLEGLREVGSRCERTGEE